MPKINPNNTKHQRQCSKCQEIKPLTNEHFSYNKCMPYGFNYVCKQCFLKYYNKLESSKAAQKRYDASETRKATKKRYFASEQGKAAQKRYRISEKGRANAKRFRTTEKGKARMRRSNKSESYLRSQKNWLLKFPKKHRAIRYVRILIALGELVRPDRCEVCGKKLRI